LYCGYTGVTKNSQKIHKTNQELKMKEKLFRELLNELNNKNKNDEYKYIGTGNPMSDILIIGKETAVSVNSEQYKTETLENFNFWLNNQDYNSGEIIERSNQYSHLYPYKGQVLKKNNFKDNWGTSVTWMNYQKLYNYIFNTPQNKQINFHENSFITEVNSTPSKKTIDADTSSIDFRKENLLNSEFFNSFSIVIISGVGYFDTTGNNNEIEDIFKVKFSEIKNAGNKPKQPYWLHWNNEKTKLLINTYQLSIGVSDVLLQEIATEIRNSNLIKLVE